MATSKFINYIAYENLYNANSVVNCSINPNKGIIEFIFKNTDFHFTKDASIQLGLWAGDDSHPFSDIRKKRLGDINDKDNIYTFSAENFPQNPADLQGF